MNEFPPTCWPLFSPVALSQRKETHRLKKNEIILSVQEVLTNLINYLLYKMDENFLDIQYLVKANAQLKKHVVNSREIA